MEGNLDENIIDNTGENTTPENDNVVNNDITNSTDDTFVIPEEYRNKGWAKNIHSSADLFKAYDNATSLIGRKTIGIPDFDKASEEEIKNFYSKLVPQDVKDYGLADVEGIDDNTKNALEKVFQENGINKKAAQNIVGFYSNMLEEAAGNDETFAEEMRNRFGDDFENVIRKESVPMLKKYLSQEDKEILERMPDKVKGMVCSLANNIKKAYGIDFNSAITNKAEPRTYTTEEYDKELLDYYNSNNLSKAEREARLNRINMMGRQLFSKKN